MKFASKLAYVTKKKIQPEAQKEASIPEEEPRGEEERKGRAPFVEGMKERSRSRSLSSISDEELDYFARDGSDCDESPSNFEGEATASVAKGKT